MYEHALAENEKLKSRLEDSKQELAKIRSQLEKVTQKQDRISERSSVLETEKREKRVLEKKVSEMEEELKVSKKKAGYSKNTQLQEKMTYFQTASQQLSGRPSEGISLWLSALSSGRAGLVQCGGLWLPPSWLSSRPCAGGESGCWLRTEPCCGFWGASQRQPPCPRLRTSNPTCLHPLPPPPPLSPPLPLPPSPVLPLLLFFQADATAGWGPSYHKHLGAPGPPPALTGVGKQIQAAIMLLSETGFPEKGLVALPAAMLCVLTELKSDNQRLKDENGALIRVISKLSK
ncbi:hypothetical protein JZ751_003691 [Albula glossodonta]|uniref:cGMP-dependent protein kinase interacting domain-containing protein n=1 Tax=Albula glossodonta TaxID=121402 RepID=A0A8T2N5U1_9TELE|nr:hypothetical protein JZ751_003691 [Albula glossodonta]